MGVGMPFTSGGGSRQESSMALRAGMGLCLGAHAPPITDSRIRGKRIQSLKPSPPPHRLPLTWESSLMFPYKGDMGLKVRQLRFKVTV